MSKVDHRNKDDWRDAFIDPKIRPLIAAMNQPHTGIKTIACCQGHYNHSCYPYVFFRCTTQTASALARRLSTLTTHYSWQVEGTFNAEFELCFLLRSASLTSKKDREGILGELLTYVIRRTRIDEDFSALTGLFKQPLSKEYPK